MTLVEFLLARIAEDEAGAAQTRQDLARWHREKAINGPDGSQGSIVVAGMLDGPSDPARVLAECAAKRRIVELWSVLIEKRITPMAWITEGLCILASVYADHPDYRQEWA